MSPAFRKPDFRQGQIELRCEQGEVAIYATQAGLRKLIDLCRALCEDPRRGHLHLEDYELLTTESLKGTLAAFSGGDEP